MTARTLATLRPVGSSIAVTVPQPGFPIAPAHSFPRGRRIAGALLVAGLAVSGLAAAGLAATGTDDAVVPAVAERPLPEGLTITGPDAISVVTQVYAPGQDSGWHVHPGVHAVAILSGALTVYDATCGAQTFVPGRPYVGGQQLHLTRNETTEPVEMVVTYITPAVPADSTRHADAPACSRGIKG